MAQGRKTGGRTKGTPNRVTRALRESVLEAFEQSGGVEYLVRVARDDPPTFCKLLAKLLPAPKVENAPAGPVTFQVVTGIDRSPEDLSEMPTSWPRVRPVES